MPPYALKPIHISCTKSHAALSLPARLAGMSRRGLLEEQGRERALLPPHTAAPHTRSRCCTQPQSRSRLAQVEVQLGLERLPDELVRVVVLKLMKLHGKQGSGA